MSTDKSVSLCPLNIYQIEIEHVFCLSVYLLLLWSLTMKKKTPAVVR